MTDSTTIPALTGSPRQIQWATTIRVRALVEIDAFRAEMAEWVAEHPEAAAEERANNAALNDVIASHPDAQWWIDHRHGGAETLAYILRQDAQARVELEEAP